MIGSRAANSRNPGNSDSSGQTPLHIEGFRETVGYDPINKTIDPNRLQDGYKWGLYDLMGNYNELTSTQRPSTLYSKRVSYMFKGDTFYSRNWHEKSIDDEYWARDLGVRFSNEIAARFVIVSESQ